MNEADAINWWDRCSLRLTECGYVRRHDLTLPNGQVVSVTSDQFLSPTKMTKIVTMATGSMPPIPRPRKQFMLKVVEALFLAET